MFNMSVAHFQAYIAVGGVPTYFAQVYGGMFSTPDGGESIIYNPDRDEIWNEINKNYGQLGYSRIDPVTGETLGKVIVTSTDASFVEGELLYPRYCAVNHRIYVGGYGPYSILVFDAINATYIGRILWPGIQYFGVHPITGNLWATAIVSNVGRVQEKDINGTMLRDIPNYNSSVSLGVSELLFDNAGILWLIPGLELLRFNPTTGIFTSFRSVTDPDHSTVFTNTGAGSAVASTKWRLNIADTFYSGGSIQITEIQFRQTAGVPQTFSGGTATASSVLYPTGFANTAASRATDGDYLFTEWETNFGVTAATWEYEFLNPVIIAEYLIHGQNFTHLFSPKNFTLEYWNGSSWVVSDTRSTTSADWNTQDLINHFTYNPVRNSIWFTDTRTANLIKEFDIATTTITKTLNGKTTGFGFTPDIMYDSYRDLIWAFNDGVDTCKAYDPTTGDLLLTVDVLPNEYPWKVTIAPNGVWINDSSYTQINRVLVTSTELPPADSPSYHENVQGTAYVITNPVSALGDMLDLVTSEVWFSWTPSATASKTINTINQRTLFDTNLTLYASDGTTVLTSNDNATADTFYSSMTYSVTSGTQYYIVVRSTARNGEFVLNIN